MLYYLHMYRAECDRRYSLSINVDAETHLMDPERLEATSGTRRPAAIVMTHLYGRVRDMARLTKLAERIGIPVFEDCATRAALSMEGGEPEDSAMPQASAFIRRRISARSATAVPSGRATPTSILRSGNYANMAGARNIA
jgi:hypothetical protein